MNQKVFDLYTDFLISALGPATATGMARVLDGQVSHDQVTRLLADAAKTSADLWRISKPLVRQIERPDGVISIDDSLSEKLYTDENDIICWHWSHSLSRHVKGIEFLTAFYTVGEVSLPIAFDLVEKLAARHGRRPQQVVECQIYDAKQDGGSNEQVKRR